MQEAEQEGTRDGSVARASSCFWSAIPSSETFAQNLVTDAVTAVTDESQGIVCWESQGCSIQVIDKYEPLLQG